MLNLVVTINHIMSFHSNLQKITIKYFRTVPKYLSDELQYLKNSYTIPALNSASSSTEDSDSSFIEAMRSSYRTLEAFQGKCKNMFLCLSAAHYFQVNNYP